MKHKFKLTRLWVASLLLLFGVSQPSLANTYYYTGSAINNWGTKQAMNVSADKLYEYYQFSNSTNQFKIGTSSNQYAYNCKFVSKGFNNTNVQNIGDYSSDNCYCWQSGTYYIIVYYPNTPINTSSDPKICASTTLPSNKFTVTYKANGGTGSDIVVSNLVYNTSHTVKAADTFTRDGWSFLKWNDGSGVAHNPGSSMTINGDVTMYAHWEKWCVYGNFGSGWDDYNFANGKVTISLTKGSTYSFKVKYCKTDNDDVYYGCDATITATEDNYKFYTWQNANCKITPSVTGDYIFEWKSGDICAVYFPSTVTFDANGHGTAPASQVITYNEKASKPTDLSETGYTFGGWYENAECTGSQWNFSTAITANKTLYAKWTVNKHNLTWNLDGGTITEAGTAEGQVAYGTTLTAPIVEKIGYTFAGWNPTVAATMPDNDVTYTATWTANTNTPYTVKHYQQNILDDNYTLVDTDNLTGTTGASVTPDVKAYTGFTAPTPQTVTIAADGSLVVTYNYTRNSHTLTWNADGGTITGDYTSGTVKYGASITAPVNANVTKDGFNFMGWMVNNEVVTPATTMPDNDLTYTAKWQSAATYSLTLVKGAGIESVSGGISDQTVLPIESEISATAKTGYTFAQWTATGEGTVSYTSGSETTANATVSVTIGSVTLTASATPNNDTPYKVKHYKQNLENDDYTLAETEDKIGTTDAQVTPDVKDYDGFTAPSTQTVTIKGDGTTEVTYNYTRNSYDISYTPQATGWTYGTQPASAKFGAEVSFVVTPTAGYTVTVSSDDVTLTPNADGKTYTFTMPAKAVAISVSASENMTTVTVNANETTWGTISGAVTSWGATTTAGVATLRTLKASAKPGYKFARWELADGATSTSTLTNASITIKGDGSSATGTATAVFEEDLTSTWYVRGDATCFCGWVTSADCMLKKETGHSTSNDVYYTVTLPANKNAQFKIWDETNKLYYGGNAEQGDTYWITSTSGSIQLYSGDAYKNLEIRGTVAGDYLIHFNTSTKKVEVTWPEKYFIAGNTQLTGKNWDVQGTEMTNRSYTFSNLAANTDYRFRITDGTWDHTWGYTDLATGSDENLATLENNNVHFTLTTAGDVTISIDTDKKVHVTTTGTFGEYRYTLWKIGGMKSDAWSDRVFMKKSGELDQSIAYYEVELTKDDYVFKIKNPSGTYLGNEGEITGNVTDWEFYEYYPGDEVKKPNCRLKATVAGIYIFKLDFTTPSVPKVSVSYPRGEGYTTTITTEGEGKVQKDGVDVTEVPLYEVYGTALTAVPNDGYHFVGWTVTGKVFIDSNNKLTDSPAYFYASGEGTIKATFAKNPTIYFNNTMSKIWGADKMYVYFYSTDYWDESEYGSGSKDILAGPFAMTQIPRTNIWEYTYDPTAAPFNRTNIKGVVFSDENMPGYEHFQNCSATYRMDYSNGCANMFVLNPQQDVVLKNVSAKYYKKGFWRNYNSLTSKMYLNIWDCDGNKGIGSYELVTDEAGNEAFSAPVNLSSNKRYNVYVGNCTGSNFSQKVEITSDNCSGFDLYEYESIDDKSQLAYLTTKSSGDYVFTLTFDDAHMLFSVEYPIMLDDYRVRMGTSPKYRYSNIIRTTEESGTISMFLNEGTNTLTYQKVTNVNVMPIVWTADGTINVNVEHSGVYTMTLSKDKRITNIQPYKGNYYIRTDCAQGGWNEYKKDGNNLMRFTDRNPAYAANPQTGYNYYYCRWNTNEKGNVRCVVANEINACISDTLKEDDILGDECLHGTANIRFAWNSNTNTLSRAYISGSYDDAEYLQVRSDGNKLFKKADGSEPIENARLDDNNDWTYIIDVYADGGAQAAVSAKYNNKYQFFVGAGDASTGEVTTRAQVIAEANKAHMQLVYDFKTDRIVTGWMPGGVITENITLQSDAILTRVHQGKLSPIKFSGDDISVLEVQTMYGVLQLDKDIMTDGHSQDADKIYERNIYWISFPFDVRVGDIFGVDGYGTKWVMQRYNGQKRADIGWFAETATFWEYMDQNDIMEANVGYTLTLDPDYFDNASDAMWANGKTSVSFYFPSITHNINVVSNGQAESSIPAHECKIDRMFDDGKKNHKTTDSHWNVIGIPTFQDLENPSFDVQSVYKWDPANNTYSIQALTDFTLEASHAYFVQWGCEDLVTWPNASIIKPKAPYKYADVKNYMVDLYFSYGDKEDHTYINLKDEAKADFVLNEDMMKVINSGQPNIYSYAGAYDVAYNATAFENQTVNLGVIARKNGSYTFAMPKDFSGKAVLVDLESGEATDLNLSNYTVELNKGTYNNRFQLLLEVEAKAPTNMNPTKGEWNEDGKTKKLFINDNIYLINAGRVYNVLGARP